MKIEKIRAAANERPFRPFEIVLENGDRVPLTHPEKIHFLRGEEMYVHANGRERHFEASAVSEVRRWIPLDNRSPGSMIRPGQRRPSPEAGGRAPCV